MDIRDESSGSNATYSTTPSATTTSTRVVSDEDVRAARGHYEKIIAMATHAMTYVNNMAERGAALAPGQGSLAAGLTRNGEDCVFETKRF